MHVNGNIRGGETAGALKLQTDYGYFSFGPMNTSFCHFKTDLPGFHFDKYVRIDADLVIWNSSGLGAGSKQIVLKSNGEIRAREIKVDLATIPDYVFAEDYNLMPLAEVKAFIETNKHLPNVKNEAQFKEEGSISLSEMNMKLLEKVEELMLYTLQQQEELNALKIEIENLKK